MKKNILILTLTFLCCVSFCSAQLSFQKKYSGSNESRALSVVQTKDNGFVFCGLISGAGTANNGIYLVSTDSLGDTLWTKIIGSGVYNFGNCLQQTKDGGFIIFGFMDPGAVLIKTDSLGVINWARSYTIPNKLLQGMSVRQTLDSGYIMVGTSYPHPSLNQDAFLIRINSVGDTLWSKTIGSPLSESGAAVIQTHDSGFAVLVDVFGGNSFLMKFGLQGNLIFSKPYHAAHSLDLLELPDSSLMIAGKITYFSGFDGLLFKTKPNGDTIWAKIYYGSGEDDFTNIHQTNDGGFILCGSRNNTNINGTGNRASLVKTNASGDTLWTRTYGKPGNSIGGFGMSVQQTMDKGYILAGYTYNDSTSNYEINLLKTDSFGIAACNQGKLATQVTQISIYSHNASLALSPSGINVSNPVLTVFSGGNPQTLCSTLGYSDLASSNKNITLFPNPSVGHFNIAFPNLIENGKLTVYDLIGRSFFASNILHESQKEIHIKGISPGIYFVKVFDGEQEQIKKICIE
ncbi:MAG: T9SS type A sorting domain-containing protein [Bacteroidetes bacterium]|nr:T9SS type A sorting domain-containing protein [Bacteroidota bacterium]